MSKQFRQMAFGLILAASAGAIDAQAPAMTRTLVARGDVAVPNREAVMQGRARRSFRHPVRRGAKGEERGRRCNQAGRCLCGRQGPTADFQKNLGNPCSERRFHDELLAPGSAPYF